MNSEDLVHRVLRTILGLAALGGVLALTTVWKLLSLITADTSESVVRINRWSELKDAMLLGAAEDRVADGAAAEHASVARQEAARKLVMNYGGVVHDITRPDGAPKSQQSLARLPGKDRDVDAALYETARRLYGRLPDEPKRRTRPRSAEQAATWAATARYLSARVQSSAAEVANTVGFEAREPDMSPAAAAVMRAVLHEVGSEKVAAPYSTMMKKAILRPFASSAGAIRAPSQLGQTL